MESDEQKVIEQEEKEVDLEDTKQYLHQFQSDFFKPLYEIFICYGHEDYNTKNEDEGSVNTSVAFDRTSRQTENARSQRERAVDEYENWQEMPHLELVNQLDSQLA